MSTSALAAPGYAGTVLLALLLGCPSPTDSAGACDLQVETAGAPGVPLTLLTGAVGLLGTEPVSIGGAFDAKVRVSGPVEVLDATGAVVKTVSGPTEVYLRATGVGAGEVTFKGDGCAAVVEVLGKLAAPLVGQPREEQPGWRSMTSLWSGDTIYLGLDPARFPDRVGREFDAWVVDHRSAEAWAADPTLVGHFGAPVAGKLEEGALVPLSLGALDAGADLHLDLDVVVDADRDGQLGPGDLVQGVGTDPLSVLTDLTAAGPHAVDTVDVSGGYFLGERVYWPTDIAAMGPRPLVVISHGNGHLYTWYDYLGEHLASWGYVVMSHENNTGPGIETASTTTLTNTDWLLGHLDQIGDGALVGLVDATRIGWIGHSRGGEGVVRAYDRLVEGDYTPENFGPDDVRFIASIAPTVFNSVKDSDPHDRPYFLLAGTADGDVTGGVDYNETQFFRIWERDTGPKAAAYVHGASHNDFNCCGTEEGQGPELIGREEAQVIARAYLLAFAHAFLDDDPAPLAVFKEEYAGFTPLSFADDDVVATGWRNAPGAGDGVLDDFQTENDVAVASSGGAVTCTATDVVEDRLRDGDGQFGWSDADPMNAMTHNTGQGDEARGMVLSWPSGASPTWAVAVPDALADTRPWTHLSLSITQRSRHPQTVAWGWALAFGVTLVDADGVSATVDVADQAEVPLPYQRVGLGAGRGWANEFVTVRVPLADFTVGSPIDLTRITTVQLDFGADHGAEEGAVGLDSVEFAR